MESKLSGKPIIMCSTPSVEGVPSADFGKVVMLHRPFAAMPLSSRTGDHGYDVKSAFSFFVASFLIESMSIITFT